MKRVRGYKVTNSDMKCRGYQYRLNEVFSHVGTVEPCESGFHFCEKPADCFNYYEFDSSNRVFEVEGWGDLIADNYKIVCSNILFLRELTWHEVLSLVNTGNGNTGYMNTGDWNTGNWNSGNMNTGNWNTGYRNAGDWNTGDRNTGNGNTGNGNTGYRNTGDRNTGNWNTGGWNTGCWNTGNRNTGFLNTDTPKFRMFNKETDIDIEDINFPQWMYFETTMWIDASKMTEEEKSENPHYETTGGYLKNLGYKEAAQMSYNNATKEDQDLVELLPNYDADILFEIFGIDRRKIINGTQINAV